MWKMIIISSYLHAAVIMIRGRDEWEGQWREGRGEWRGASREEVSGEGWVGGETLLASSFHFFIKIPNSHHGPIPIGRHYYTKDCIHTARTINHTAFHAH